MRARSLAHLRLLLGGLAASGALAAHAIVYLLAEPQHHHPGSDPAAVTSGGSWMFLAPAALGLTVAGVVRLAFVKTSSPSISTSSSGSLFATAAMRLVPLQVLGCVGLQTLERLASGEHITTALTEPAVLIGASLQVLVAFIGAFILVLFTKAIDLFLGRSLPFPSAARPACPRPISRVLPARFQVAAGLGTLRGPPLVN
jgi:hypothetical protein